MDSLAYHLVYVPEIPWDTFTAPLVGLLVGLSVGVVFMLRDNADPRRYIVAIPMAAFSCLYATLFGYMTYRDYVRARDAALSPKTPMGEGVVEHFVAERPGPDWKNPESFTVQGIPFVYSQFQLTGGFRQPRDSGGPITGDGIRVRIRYLPTYHSPYDSTNVIVKLEIAHPKDAPARAAAPSPR